MMKKIFSELLQLHGEENDGTVTFEDGTVYSPNEIVVLKKAKETKEDIKRLHWVKAAFGGDLEYYGKAQMVKVKKEVVPDAVQLSLFAK